MSMFCCVAPTLTLFSAYHNNKSVFLILEAALIFSLGFIGATFFEEIIYISGSIYTLYVIFCFHFRNCQQLLPGSAVEPHS